MRLFRVALLIALVCLILVEICDTARGSRGGRSRGKTSGSNNRSGSAKNSRTRKSSGTGGSASKPKTPKTTKHTPIKATSPRTPVIVSQTKLGSRSTSRNVVFGYITYRYLISNAPVYRHGYPMYRQSVVIPEERAVRIMSTETKMLDNDGKLCLNESLQGTERSVPDDANKNVIQVNTTVQYGNEKPAKFDGIDQKFTLREQEGLDFEIVSRRQYNTTLVKGVNCFVVEERVSGTVIHLYQTNPDGATTLVLNAWFALLTVLVAFAFGQ